MAGRKPLYHTAEEMPVSCSLRIPRGLYDETQRYLSQHRMSMTEFVLDAIRLRLDTPADPREVLVSDSSNTAIQELQAMVDAAVETALAKRDRGTPAPTDDIQPSTDAIQHDGNTVWQEPVQDRAHDGNTVLQEKAPRSSTRRGVPKLTPRQIRALRDKRQRGVSIPALMDEYGISRASVFRYLQSEKR